MSPSTRPLSFALSLALILAGCGSGDTSRVSIDLAPLWQQSAQQIDIIYVRVYDNTGLLNVEEVLTNANSALDLEVIAGPALRFEVEALFNEMGAGNIPSLWGERVVDVQPDADIELVVPVFPAGAINGTVIISDATPIPHGTQVIAVATQPRVDAPAERAFDISAGGFTGTLPDGDYTLTVSFTDSIGTTYSGSLRVIVVREALTAVGTIDVAPL